MKKYLFLLGTAAALTACNNSSSTAENKMSDSTSTTMASTESDNMVKNRSIYKAIQSGDSATIRSLIADDAVDHMGMNGMDVKGRDSITHMLTDMHNHVDGLQFDVVSDAAHGDYIFAMVDMKGTMKDNAWGMPAGSKVDGRSVDVVKVKDGKMVEHWGFMDQAEMMRQMNKMNAGTPKK